MKGKINSTITGEIINVPISMKLLQGITSLDLPETDAGLGERVNDILRSYLYEREKRDNEYGDPEKGFLWANVFMPNATRLRMVYENKIHYAAVKYGKVIYENESYSPSGMVRKIANGAERYAWKDLFIQLYGSDMWERAQDIRYDNANNTFFRRSERRMGQKVIRNQ